MKKSESSFASEVLRFCVLAIVLGIGGCSGGDVEMAAEEAETVEAEKTESELLIERSIAFHDPQGAWGTGTFRLHQTATRPGGEDRNDLITIADSGSRFRLESQRSGKPFTIETANDEVEVTVEGQLPTEEVRAELRLDDAGALRMRNYYVYLYGLPMKLQDPGALIDPQPKQVDFDGREALEVRVAYDPEVGSDVWYFTFDPDTGELIGYRFYHDEAANDGEYIELEGLASIGSLLLPSQRAWYKFEGNEHLGTDTIRQAD